MKAYIDHVSLNVSNLAKSKPFYDSLLTCLGFKSHAGDGWTNDKSGVWINQADDEHRDVVHDRKNIGVTHFAFRLETRAEVDEFYEQFLLPNKVVVLYGGPKEYPQYTEGYYAVFFEDPDGFKLEGVYLP